jgi:hypothetical protein
MIFGRHSIKTNHSGKSGQNLAFQQKRTASIKLEDGELLQPLRNSENDKEKTFNEAGKTFKLRAKIRRNATHTPKKTNNGFNFSLHHV